VERSEDPAEIKMAKQINSGTGILPVCFSSKKIALKNETHGRDARATKL
jgi:hypothetical protein